MKLSDLLAQLRTEQVKGNTGVEIAGITADSRRVRPGYVFVAHPGTRVDGASYIGDAIGRGAVAVVSTKPAECGDATLVVVSDSREALADLACAFYGRPSAGMGVAGVTGTNGKTTTVFLIQHICDAALLRCGLIGTVRYQIGEQILPAKRTTPEADELQNLLARMRDGGCKTVAMEVSSHSVVLKRIRGVEFDVAVFTNLTQDHLDFHGTMEAYFEAKAQFLESLDSQRFKAGKAVINLEDRYSVQLQRRLQQRGIPIITFGFGVRCDFRASNVRSDVHGTNFQLDALGRSWLVRLPLIGSFNILNALGAIAAAHALGVDVRTAVLALANAPAVPGRLEPVPGKRGFRVFVDYAHTDDALRNVLRTLRELEPRRIITVFGCGGDRDAAKRPLMGAVANEMSDWVIVTSDNPRSESPEVIAGEIAAAIHKDRHEIILDRKAAIIRAVEMARPRDIVLIAGKGHEGTQETNGKFEPFSDVAVAQAAIENRPGDFGR